MEEKRYKIEEIEEEISESKKNSVVYAVLSGTCSILTAAYMIDYVYINNPIQFAIGTVMGAIGIYKITNYINEEKKINNLLKLRDEIIKEIDINEYSEKKASK